MWFVFQGGKLLVRAPDATPSIPVADDLSALNLDAVDRVHLGTLDGTPCLATDIPDGFAGPDHLSPRRLRPLLDDLSPEHAAVALRAAHIVHWRRTHRRCGRCGAPLVDCEEERARRCPKCGLVCYPRISPAVITAVVRDGRLLLASEPRFSRGLYSVLAGFVEPGESLEECVRREVLEEVGIEVVGIRYFGSQPWPFPDSLMVAFTADHAAGEIRIDQREILRAAWFAPDDLPEIPSRASIARSLIDWFVNTYGSPSAVVSENSIGLMPPSCDST